MKRGFPNHFMVLASFFGLFLAQASAETEVGKVVSLTGKVMARIESKAGRASAAKVRMLKPADPIFREDILNTDSNGSVKILFRDQSNLDLGQSSLFKIEEFDQKGSPEERKIEMSLSYGKIRAAINQKVGALGKFKIKTRAATMGVRGTEFYILSEMEAGEGDETKARSPETKIVVTEGKVEVRASAKPVELLPGEKLTATLDPNSDGAAGRAPASVVSVEAVAPDEMKSVVESGKLKDTTFSQAIQIEESASSLAKDAKGASTSPSFGGTETMSVIQETLLSSSEIRNPVQPSGGFSVPGGPMMQAGFSGNFLPGFITAPLVRLRITISP